MHELQATPGCGDASEENDSGWADAVYGGVAGLPLQVVRCNAV